jgi:putative thioredoxin
MSNFSGAFDLSKLANQNQAQNAGNAVAGWLVPADEQVLRRYLQLSESVPVLMLIVDGSEASNAVSGLVEAVIAAAKGRFAGIQVDLRTSPQLAQAIGVTEAPAMAAILAGAPTPLFKGVVNQEQLVQVLGQVLQMAAQSNITGSVTVSDTAAEPAKKLTPEHQAAVDAVERGDLVDALAKFEKLTVEYPSDAEIKAGLAQVQLLHRLQNPVTETALDKLFAEADQTLITGEASAAFDLLLDRFAVDFEMRDPIRARLLDLFTVTGDSHEAVMAARRKLASLMF